MGMSYKNLHWMDKKIIIGQGSVDPEKPIKLLIGFHGADSLPENMLVHGNQLKLNNAVMVYPEGPVDAGEGLWSWWLDGPKQKDSVKEFLTFTHELVQKAQQHIREEFGSTSIKTNLWGFSQGAAAALVYALLGERPVNKVASICGFLPELPEDSTPNSDTVTILGIYGLNDGVIPSFLADYALEEMKNKGHQLTIKETTQSHEISSDNLLDMNDFFNAGG